MTDCSREELYETINKLAQENVNLIRDLCVSNLEKLACETASYMLKKEKAELQAKLHTLSVESVKTNHELLDKQRELQAALVIAKAILQKMVGIESFPANKQEFDEIENALSEISKVSK